MTLIETLNKVGIVGDAISITFTAPDGEDDIDADEARDIVVQYLIREIDEVKFDSNAASHVHQLCIYGAKLFDAIDNHDADPSDHDSK